VAVSEIIAEYLKRWDLTVDGAPTMTPTSAIARVYWDGKPAILKVAILEEEKRGNRLMIWWDGVGAARVLASADDAILMERAEQGISLADLAREGHDDEASRTLCAALHQLHVLRAKAPPSLPSLATWFEPLAPVARAHQGILRRAHETASKLLTHQREISVLHGDMHHGNLLKFEGSGWLAIDPKGLIGERGFDYANIFLNPDLHIAAAPGRLARQIKVVADAASLESRRLLSWVLAWAGLAASFSFEDGTSADAALKIAEIAAAELDR
jgi:streptomycin 6-kinase